MGDLFTFTITGLITGAAFAIAASGLVITYATSNVFNVAHGAVGMLMTFIYWQILELQWLTSETDGVIQSVALNTSGVARFGALLIVVLIVAPIFGALLERVMMRGLAGATVARSLTVTVGLMVGLIGIAIMIWGSGARRIDKFFPDSKVRLAGVNVDGHQLLIFFLALSVALVIYYLLKFTRTGIGMRAIVDDRMLISLHGANPSRLSMLSWAIGSSLAALAGILLSSTIGLDFFTLTFLVISAYAAAMVGQLKNLPRSFVGALVLGALSSYLLLFTNQFTSSSAIFLGAVSVGLLVAAAMKRASWTVAIVGIVATTAMMFGLPQLDSGTQSGFRAALPALFLFAVMMVMPQEQLRVGAIEGASLVKLPSWGKTIGWSIALLGVTIGLVNILSRANQSRLGAAFAIGMVMLSLVVLSGYGGDVSLAQMTFVGFGALTVVKMGGSVNILSLVVAGLVAAVIGAIVALPALRLRGLYLALATMAFAGAMEKLVFENASIGFALGGRADISRPSFIDNEKSFAVVCAVGFVLMAVFTLWLRRGRYGRFLLATRDSQAACATLGMNITLTRVLVFSISAAMAGIAGVFLGGMNEGAGASEFIMFQSLPVLLLATVGGITSVTGALIGGMAIGFQNASDLPAGASYVITGFLAILMSRLPNGLAGLMFGTGKGGDADAELEYAFEEEPALAAGVEDREEVTAGATS